MAAKPLEVEVRPPWPHRLPARGSPDWTTRVRGGVLTRLLHADRTPVVVHVWRRREGSCVLRATSDADVATSDALEIAIDRMRFALGIDDDFRPFYDAFRGDRLLARAIRRRPWIRPRRNTSPWEAIAWAITKQLIESPRAAAIQRRIVRRWGPKLRELRDVPGAAAIAGAAPAELASMDLSPSRAVAMVRTAREVATGRADPRDPRADRRLVAIPGIGTWTVRCLGLFGRGDPDSLPSGDLGYVKLIGRLAGLGRRATEEEVEEFFEPYAPFRGLAGTFMLGNYHALVKAGPPLRRAA